MWSTFIWYCRRQETSFIWGARFPMLQKKRHKTRWCICLCKLEGLCCKVHSSVIRCCHLRLMPMNKLVQRHKLMRRKQTWPGTPRGFNSNKPVGSYYLYTWSLAGCVLDYLGVTRRFSPVYNLPVTGDSVVIKRLCLWHVKSIYAAFIHSFISSRVTGKIQRLSAAVLLLPDHILF